MTSWFKPAGAGVAAALVVALVVAAPAALVVALVVVVPVEAVLLGREARLAPVVSFTICEEL